MVCCFVYNFKVLKFQIGHRSDFNWKFSICWNQTGHRFQRVEIWSVADFGDGNRKSKWALRLSQCFVAKCLLFSILFQTLLSFTITYSIFASSHLLNFLILTENCKMLTDSTRNCVWTEEKERHDPQHNGTYIIDRVTRLGNISPITLLFVGSLMK